ncbi:MULTISPECIES: rod shape-determining protein RodA [Clostridium]|uniref:Peptidoglycan glycosyltransferase RodA n=2 Tax=Clostridium TaxID=1485 RepID=D8GNV3_CLOLD|nr:MULTISPECIES: rod shape-determining protein RodA [Clostridium]ADK13799.1 predicted rod shape-determining protein RodA [Clostridium ljungdahlii DSM 13528]AGY77028.1 rod shape-determining protein RodA [Clostridium autoethanogenum DSM 10061]ALU37170.1 putative rod shape-determining protein RodA [Clostridium autoethanogenum DSM 10061]OAA85047.1 Rod shape-determining protein RodA [Clostridium ljungdahlii DSM 13528]OVY50257.1 Rod shape-determining protein RodA [Clostridium autoethanogenum]
MLEKFVINRKLLREFDFPLLITVIIICIFGSLNIYSASHMSDGTYYLKSQLMYMAVGLVLTYFILLVDYSVIKGYVGIIYWFGVFLLIINCIPAFQATVNGASSWIKLGPIRMQPSEFAKIGIILMIAKKLEDMEGNINNVKNFIKLMIYPLIPMALIVKQPDMGMTMVCFFAVLGIVFIAKLDLRVLIGGLLALTVLIVIALNTPLIEEYQKMRIISLFNPEKYQMSYALQVTQSQIGIGSGGIWGKGFLKGTQISGGYVPEAHTDFIFSVVGEEWGLVGALALILFYVIILYRSIKISREAKDIFGSIVCVGIASMMLFSIFQNVGMTIGLLPITGITLPFMSAGGSSLLAAFIEIALILNIGMRRKKINF